MGLRDTIASKKDAEIPQSAPHRRIREIAGLLDESAWADLIDCLDDESITAPELRRAIEAEHGLILGEHAIRNWRRDTDSMRYVRRNVAA